MNKLKLLLEIIKHSTKAKIIACSVGVGVIAIGGGIAYGIASNNNSTVADNKNGSEIVTTYNEKDKEEVKDKELVREETKDESKPVVNEEVKKDDTSTSTSSTSTSSGNEKPSTTTSDTKPNSGTTTEPQVETPPANPQVVTPPSYKAAGIDWELTNKLNSWLDSKFSISLGCRSSEVLSACSDVLIKGDSFPDWIMNGFVDDRNGITNKYIEHKIGSVTFSEDHASDDPVNLLSLSQLMKKTAIMDSGLSSAEYKYCYAKYDGSGNLIISMIQLRVL